MTLPEETVSLVEDLPCGSRHPGLLLDKFTAPGDQKEQRRALDAVCQGHGCEDLLAALRERRDQTLGIEAIRLRATTIAPLTLHLARAAALENAGLHLHPLYGFCCLPASGIKGMARAWAETAWLADQKDGAQAWRCIRQAFGWSPGSDRRKPWRPENADDAKGSRAGDVVVHDAWPKTWPPLATDITNNHHPRYYQGDDDPGDWEDPVPVYFLIVPAGVEFDFAVSLRNPGATDGRKLLHLARDWIAGALCHAGAGAKTNAGYGRFQLCDLPEPPRPRRARASWSDRLTLSAPAVLAGARQEEADCELRPATLRGLLRWWWRTMHAGHLERANLRRLETAIWGSSETAGALALTIGDGRHVKPTRSAFKRGFKLDQEFAREHGIQPPAKHSKTIQGLFYASYGMDEKNRHRWYVDADASWNVTLTAREGTLPGTNRKATLSADQILAQGQAALWLLCRFGGVGSKARKGFGSFRDLAVDGIDSVEECHSKAQALREALELNVGRCANSPKLEELMLVERRTEWNDAWFAVDQIGAIYQAVVKGFDGAVKNERLALGLPRRVGKPPTALHAGAIRRHAAPIHWSLSRNDDGRFLVRFAAFPAPKLPDPETSKRVLEQAGRHAKELLKKQATAKPHKGAGGAGSSRPGRSRQRSRPATPANPAFQTPRPRSESLPRPGEKVECVILRETTKKGGKKAKDTASGVTGPIVNNADVPADVGPGRVVELVVAYARPGDAQFRWPTPDDPSRPNNRKQSGPSRRGPRR